jgi:hypothetical protein
MEEERRGGGGGGGVTSDVLRRVTWNSLLSKGITAVVMASRTRQSPILQLYSIVLG